MRRVKFTCEMCGKKDMKASEMELDHIQPLVTEQGFKDWNEFFEHYLVDASGFQYICASPCHSEKTKREMGAKYKERRKKKSK